jgi:hypothetical protein
VETQTKTQILSASPLNDNEWIATLERKIAMIGEDGNTDISQAQHNAE